MRLWIALLVIMILIVGAGIYVDGKLLETTQHTRQSLQELVLMIDEGDWDCALSAIENTVATWSEKTKWWDPFVQNNDLGEVELSLSRVESYVRTRNKTEALAEIDFISLRLVQIHDQESLTLHNIF